MMPLLLLALVATAASDPTPQEIDCAAMRTKQLRTFLHARGLKCEGCAEKADFVALCEANKDTPVLPPKDTEEPAMRVPKDDKNIDDILGSLKGMPGMEGIKMFTADDLKNMNPEQMGNAFGGGGSSRSRPTKTRAQWKEELTTFYTRYGLESKVSGVDAALDKWRGREQKMMDVLYKKYDKEIKAHWDSKTQQDATKEEL